MEQKKDDELKAPMAPDDEISEAKDISGISADRADSESGAGTIEPQETCEPEIEGEQPQQKKHIGRYEIICLLGEGGMGQVYKARDPSLNRYVALKILHGDETALLERFLREANTQAQVQHQHACKIYEVGEADGKPFIAMQYIEGKTLRDASEEMTREQKVKAIKEAAEALHAAHKVGLIHRDIKPNNIMVEREEDGSYKPYIMDFGIAREQKTEGLTVTGILIGTPAYMSPEQALGDIHNLDRRTDIYSLGAALYELLSGSSPFQANTNAEIVMKVLQDEPVPLRRLNALVPEELQTIVMKCLEKDPERRYDTARALAEDLGRFLEGEPILAHPASFSYRLYKKARKNKIAAVLIIIVLLVIITAGGYAINLKWTAGKQAELNQQLGQQIEKMDNILYRAYTLPLHDTRKEKGTIREMINEIQRIGKTAGYAKAPSLYAIGRGYLALNEYEKAKANLEQAWNLGYQKPEAAYALGRTFGALYWQNLQEVEQIKIKEMRENKRKEVEQLYKQPALQYMKQAIGIETATPDFVEAQIAYFENQYDDALKRARNAYMRIPDLYEAHILEGDIYVQIAWQKDLQGLRNDVKNYRKKAIDSYSAAIEIGRSDASGYIGLCRTKGSMSRIIEKPEQQKQFYEEALQACEHALQADPESAKAYLSQSEVYNRRASQISNAGKDPIDIMQKSIEASRKALEIEPENAAAYRNIGLAYLWKAGYDQLHEKDSNQSLENALAAFQQAITISPRDEFSYHYKGWANGYKANNEYWSGQDWHDSQGKAIQAFLKVIEINPNSAKAYGFLSNYLVINASWELDYGNDPRESAQKAIMHAQKAISINKNSSYAYINMVYAYNIQAHYLLQQGINPLDDIKKGEQAIQQAIKLNPKESFCGYDPLSVVEARWLMRQHQDPAAAFDRAVEEMEHYIAIFPDDFTCYLYTSDVYRWKTEWKLSKNKPAGSEINQGLAMIDKSISLNPGFQESYALKGVLYLLKAKSENDSNLRLKLLQEARKLIEDTLSRNRNIKAKYQPSLDEVNEMLK